uniref:Uncharacterized protein n=1 Tax=Haemonchus contortus TaxID=6289 RepID=A0A7I5E9N6_HAECO
MSGRRNSWGQTRHDDNAVRRRAPRSRPLYGRQWRRATTTTTNTGMCGKTSKPSLISCFFSSDSLGIPRWRKWL